MYYPKAEVLVHPIYFFYIFQKSNFYKNFFYSPKAGISKILIYLPKTISLNLLRTIVSSKGSFSLYLWIDPFLNWPLLFIFKKIFYRSLTCFCFLFFFSSERFLHLSQTCWLFVFHFFQKILIPFKSLFFKLLFFFDNRKSTFSNVEKNLYEKLTVKNV